MSADLESAIAHAIELGEQVFPDGNAHRVQLRHVGTRPLGYWSASLSWDDTAERAIAESVETDAVSALAAVEALAGFLDNMLSIRRCG